MKVNDMIMLSRNEMKYILSVLYGVKHDEDYDEVENAIEMVEGLLVESERIDHLRLVQLEAILNENKELLGVEKDAETAED